MRKPIVRRTSRSWFVRARVLLVLASVCAVAGWFVGAADASAVTAVAVTPDSFLSGNASATWTVDFTTSGTGSLSAGNAVEVRFPVGFDLTLASGAFTTTGFTGTCTSPTTTGNGQWVIIQLPATCGLNASTAATVTVTGVSGLAQVYNGAKIGRAHV